MGLSFINRKNWLLLVVVGLVCGKGSKVDGRRDAASVVSAPNQAWISAGDVESPSLLLLPSAATATSI